jgi:hypothetical protein
MSKKAGGSSRKLGRNKISCALYRSQGRQEKNKKRRIAQEARRVAHYAARRDAMETFGLSRSEAKVFVRTTM